MTAAAAATATTTQRLRTQEGKKEKRSSSRKTFLFMSIIYLFLLWMVPPWDCGRYCVDGLRSASCSLIPTGSTGWLALGKRQEESSFRDAVATQNDQKATQTAMTILEKMILENVR